MLNNRFIQQYTTIPICTYKSGILNYQTRVPAPLSNHKDFEIIYIKSGSAMYTVNDSKAVAHEGSMIFLSPYMVHTLDSLPDVDLEYLCLCFDPSLILNKALVADLENNRFFIKIHIEPDSVHYNTLINLFNEICSSTETAKPFWEMNVMGNLNLMFAYLMQNNLYLKASQPSSTTVFSKNVINYIEEHYHEYITSHSIADDMHYHQSYFCRLFKKVFGLCFNEYLCLLRLEKAKVLLINSPDISVTDIAFEAGFSNLSYFSKKFREQYKISPNQFRQNNAGDTIRKNS